MAKRAVLYARVSTDEEGRQDPENQLIPLRKYADARGFEVVGEFHEHASGMDDNRPQLKEMMRQAELERKPFDVIIIFKTDRFTRRAYTLYDLFKRLKEAKVTLISMEESMDTSSMYSEGLMLILGIVAGWEREGIVQRVRAGVEKAQRNGTKTGRPFGRPKRGDELKGRKCRPSMERMLQIVTEEPGISVKQLAVMMCIPRTTLDRYLTVWAYQNEGVAEYISRHRQTSPLP